MCFFILSIFEHLIVNKCLSTACNGYIYICFSICQCSALYYVYARKLYILHFQLAPTCIRDELNYIWILLPIWITVEWNGVNNCELPFNFMDSVLFVDQFPSFPIQIGTTVPNLINIRMGTIWKILSGTCLKINATFYVRSMCFTFSIFFRSDIFFRIRIFKLVLYVK